jgi:hypothetical protein
MPASPKLVLASAVPAEQAAVVGTTTAFYAAAQTAGTPLLGLVTGASGFRLARRPRPALWSVRGS